MRSAEAHNCTWPCIKSPKEHHDSAMKETFHTMKTAEVDEEALASHLTPLEKKLRGAYFTPQSVVQRTIEAVLPLVPTKTRLRVVDPSCGAGAFLTAAHQRWPEAELWGFDVDSIAAHHCRTRLPHAHIAVADALTTSLPPRNGAFELWLGNPPYNGTSPLLKNKKAWTAVCSWMPPPFQLPKRTSLREDYAFFLLLAANRLRHTPGALAFITSTTLLDAFAYAPLRAGLLSAMRLHHVIELPPGAFANTRVKTCITVWTTPGSTHEVRSAKLSFVPQAPEWILRPVHEDALKLHRRWSVHGAPLTSLIPVTFAGLKTRFDELLVDDNRERLEERISAFLGCRNLEAFAKHFGLTAFVAKLAALKQHAVGARFNTDNVSPFIRYRGAQPRGAPAWCYVDRALIPRGDHRLRGTFNPHAARVKLAFNMREVPLWAELMDEPGCVTMYRHTRFAPDFVPRALIENPTASVVDAQDLVPNLTPLAQGYGTVHEVFARVVREMTSLDFQNVWAPNFGTTRTPMICLSSLSPTAHSKHHPTQHKQH